ncbi:MAG: hypothetical protein JXR76_05300 [Deltaproteobacteria bacterium]|nr:hypothetical protein [Deltaproteobacteria bacterium]
MKTGLLLRFFLPTIGIFMLTSCMDREPAPMCPLPTELKVSEPGTREFDGVDILVAVDNSKSMSAEQAILATSFFPLVNSLINPPPDPNWTHLPISNVRLAITTTDMGVSYNDQPFEKDSKYFADAGCIKPGGKGDNGAFLSVGKSEINLQEGVIPCGGDDRQCPPDWTCERKNDNGLGVCMAPGGNTKVTCPQSPDSRSQLFVDEKWEGNKALAVACLADVGLDGCNFEQQLMAAAAGLKNSNNLEKKENSFMRKRSITAVIVVSDEEDCSLKDGKWHSVDELNPNDSKEANVACGRYANKYLLSVDELKERYIKAKEDIGGKREGVVFAAIVGVPPGSACEGIGSELDDCMDVQPKQNGNGTMGTPDEVWREVKSHEQKYYEFACQREDKDNPGEFLTQATPGTRYVKMAEKFGNNGYVYSICNADWSPAMQEIAGLIAKNLGGTCYPKRLSWNPGTEMAECNVVMTYQFSKKEYKIAPTECPADKGQQWENPKGELHQDADGKSWLLACTVKKLPAPINCEDMVGNEDYKSYSDDKKFGWYYCENPGENNTFACTDHLDNDQDGDIDELDDDCKACIDGDPGCAPDCPYKVSLTTAAQEEVIDAFNTNVVCLQQYRFEDPNCKESTAHACNDGLDNDGNGPFDCWSYSKDEEIDKDHFPLNGARNADPDCCPMQAGDNNRCEFLDARGIPALKLEKAAWAQNCLIDKPSARNMPDACCEAATALLCVLPDEYRDSCENR